LRVAAITEAAAAVIDEKGYEGATMAEIAARSGTKIGSLYRFFPNKESVADTILVGARENIDAVFDRFDASVNALSSAGKRGSRVGVSRSCEGGLDGGLAY
jgi:AcrR family transcriptional regulator